MRGWVELLIPFIAVAVYLLSHLLSNRQEAPRREPQPLRRPPRPRRDEDDDAETPTRQRRRAELDQQLAEARRRRDALEAGSRPRPVVRPPVVLPLPLPVKPSRAVLPTEPPRPKTPPPRAEAVVLVATAAPVKAPNVTLAAPAPSSTPVQQLLGLLKDRRSMATAILLHEVLGPPVSRRPRRYKQR
jgi:hypothetical protein